MHTGKSSFFEVMNERGFSRPRPSGDHNSFRFQTLLFYTNYVNNIDTESVSLLCYSLLLRMEKENKTEAFYDRLKQQLKDDTVWPTMYLYKFIVPASLEKIAEIEGIFDNTNAIINTRDSSKGTYTSVSVKVTMESPDAVIQKYLEVSKVEGVISL